MFCVSTLYGFEEPTAIAVRHGGERSPRVFEIAKPTSMLATDICIEYLSQAYGDDLGREVWPIRKGSMS